VRIPERETRPVVYGEVSLAHLNGYPRLAVREWGNHSQDASLLPDLYVTKLGNWQGNAQRWEGFQREHPNASAFVQEWMITFLAERPPQDVINGMRGPMTGRLG